MSFFDSETDIESDDECVKAVGVKFDQPLALLERSLYEIVKNAKDPVFKCHCLARLDTDETGLESRLNGLISALSLESSDEAGVCAEKNKESGDDFDSVMLSCAEDRVESDEGFLLAACEATCGVDTVKDEFDYLEEADFVGDGSDPDLDTSDVFEPKDDDFDAFL